ncbi:MAG TPA: rhomboid family intramembrane serine protease [Candidatus Choladousia intestinavium]|uniref:Rhomboid family intramembrane serine protease n=1 Tax=Candidatus Choladousia intestinavium TaxID=2840727 RepID=A0A9D1AB97_9FIRM|nr:rhomboid family intramembrane serine protease [Candidatus Choladousia intestinavium]
MSEIRSFLKNRQPVTLLIVGINIAVFIVLSILGNTEDALFMLNHGAVFVPLVVDGGEYYRIFTSMFLHFGLQHLFYNMLVLIFLGDYLEAAVGKIRFLIIYLAGGIAGNLLSIAYELYTREFAVSAGASGAIFSVTGALIYLVLRKKDRVPGLSGQRLILMAVLTILQGMTAIGIDNEAHIGGLAAGFLLGWLLTLRM